MARRQSSFRRNIEVKATCADRSDARRAARRLGARRVGVLVQTDTYFHVRTGRLKLREIVRGERHAAELIWYRRANRASARPSDYLLIPITRPAELSAVLAAALGVRAVVRKRRELWMFRNVRIHLDAVEGLGDFIELEAVVSHRDDEATSRRRLAAVASGMKIEPEHQVSGSYGDFIGSPSFRRRGRCG